MSLQWGSFADAGFKELVASADPTLNISEQPVSERYTLGQEIGCGSYGRAVLARRIEDGLQVVVKQIRLFEMDEKARMDTLTEAKVLAQFNHVNIVHYHECLLEGGVLNIVMEYANGGDLAAAIQRRQQEKKPYSEEEIMFWFVQVVLALYHVHSKKILHRDLKSQNIFIAEGNLLKLGDFGIARVLNSDTELARTVIGSPYYLSPEICEDRPYNRKSDVWSLGCVLYELSTLRRAFDGQSLPALVVKILRGKYPPVPSRYSLQLRSLIESMLKQNPKDRPSAEAILRSDFVRLHVERYAAHVVALGLGPGAVAAAEGQADAAAAAAAALGLAAFGASEPRSRPSPAPHRAVRPLAARPPRGPSVSGMAAQAPGTPSSPGILASPNSAPPATAAAAAPGSGGGSSGAAEGDRSTSSHEVSETDTSASTPAEGSSPQKVAVVARRGQRLVESGWVRQQQAALAALAGALQAQKGGAAADGGVGGGGGGDVRASPSREAGLEATVLAGGAAGPGPGAGPGLGAAVMGAGASFAGATAAKAKVAEARQQREAEVEAQRRANAALREQKKAAAARRNTEAATAIRNRQAERQKETERNLAEQKAEMEAKARKAMQLAAAIKGKEEARRREQEEVAQHMSSHREHLRAVKSRINKDQLSELGAQFKARMATAIGNGEAAGGGAPQVLVVDFSAAHNQERPSSSASCSTSATKGSPLRAGSGAGPGAAAERRGRLAPGQAASPMGRVSRGAGAAAGGSAGASASDGAGPSGRAKPAVEPPWKQRHKQGKAQGFPEVQIFTPFGTDAPAAGGDGDGEGEGDGEGDPQAAAGVLEVLAQIHTVLEVHDGGEDEEDGAADPRMGGGGGGSAAACRDQRDSTSDDDDLSDGGGGDSRGTRNGGGGAAASAAAINAIKVEQLRMDLERDLGATAFLAAYRCLRDMQDRADDGDGDGGSGSGTGTTASSTTTQGDLERILGAKLHLARHVHKLITLEDAVFAC